MNYLPSCFLLGKRKWTKSSKSRTNTNNWNFFSYRASWTTSTWTLNRNSENTGTVYCSWEWQEWWIY
jgi:hypothetical protein